MSPEVDAIVRDAAELDVELSIRDDRIHYRGFITESLKERIGANRTGVIKALTAAAPAESALVFVVSLDREMWIASDHEEAARLRTELASEGAAQPVIVADDVVKLEGQPRELVGAAVRALTVFDGAKVIHVENEPIE